jgi:drug/metabolite transporter (DMT)-like permease
MPSRASTWASLAVLTLIWGTTWAAIRIGLEGIPPATGIALRFAIAAAVLLAVSPLFGARFGRSRLERKLWLANAVLTFAIPYGVLYWAEQWVPSGLAAVLWATFPLLVALVSHWGLPEHRLSRRGWVGIAIGFAGVAIIFSHDFGALGGRQVALAACVLLLSPLSASFGSVTIKKWGHDVHPFSISAVPMAITAALMGILAWAGESHRAVVFTTRSTGAVLYLAVLGSAVPFVLYFWLLKRESPTTLSLINYAIPVVAVAVGSLLLDEPVTGRMVVGAAFVVAGVAAVAMGGKTG